LLEKWRREHPHDTPPSSLSPSPTFAHSSASLLRGHYGYYGLPHNYRALNGFREEVRRIWFNCLQRRSQKGRRMSWEIFDSLTARFPLPLPRITHPWAAQA